jgi:hypothetical protein
MKFERREVDVIEKIDNSAVFWEKKLFCMKF